MAREVTRGDIWLYRFEPPDKRRPVLVLTRDDAIPLLNGVIVAPVTSTMRGSPGEVALGVEHGLKHPSAANLDRVQCVERTRLVRYVGHVDAATMQRVCSALAIATGCSA